MDDKKRYPWITAKKLALALPTCMLILGMAPSRAGEPSIATGSIFGVQIGEPIMLSLAERKMVDRDESASFVRKDAAKPVDVKFLQIYVTPMTHVVTEVAGASEVRTKTEAKKFIAKYADLLSGLNPKLTKRTDARNDNIYLTSQNWDITLMMTDMRTYGRPAGYHVRISMQAAGQLRNALSQRKFEEAEFIRKEHLQKVIERGRADGSLRGLN